MLLLHLVILHLDYNITIIGVILLHPDHDGVTVLRSRFLMKDVLVLDDEAVAVLGRLLLLEQFAVAGRGVLQTPACVTPAPADCSVVNPGLLQTVDIDPGVGQQRGSASSGPGTHGVATGGQRLIQWSLCGGCLWHWC